MLRAGPLSRNDVIEKLNKNFINTSIIIPEFRNTEEVFTNETARAWAKTIAREFSYPVDSVVLSSSGKPLSQQSIEEKFHALREGKIGKTYMQFLDEGLQNDK